MSNSPLDDELQEVKLLAKRLQLELQLLTDRIDHLERRCRLVSNLVSPPPAASPPAPTPVLEVPVSPVSIPPPTPVKLPSDEPRKPAKVEEFVQRINREPPELLPEKTPVSNAGAGIEERIGKIWLNRIGAVILLLGVAFFVKYSFDQGWISPVIRICIGVAIGLGLIAVGEFSLAKGKRPFAAGVLGAGIVVLYFSAFAAHYFYQLISTETTFALLCGVTVLSSAIAVHGRMLAIAIMGIVGGFWTPIALSTGVNQQVALMTYLLILDAGFLVVGSIRRWDVLRLLCWLGSAGLFAGWWAKFYHQQDLFQTLGFLTAFYLVFHAETVVSLLLKRAENISILPAVVHINNAAFFAATYFLSVDSALDPWLGLVCVVLAAAQLLIGWQGVGQGVIAQGCRVSFFLDGAAMLALAAPIQFDRYFVPVAWGAQSAVTFLFCRWSSRPWLRLKAVAILLAALGHLFLYDMGETELTKTLASVGHWNLNWITVLYVGLGVFAYLGALCLGIRRSLPALDLKLVCGLVFAGSGVMLAIWAYEYERYLAAWWWLGLAAVWLMLSKPVPSASLVFSLLSLAGCAKFLGWDTVAAVQRGSWSEINGIVLNRAVLTGLLVCLAMVLTVRQFRLYMNRLPHDSPVRQFVSPDEFAPVLVVLACLPFTWTGTFEIARIFTFEAWGKGFDHADRMSSLAVTAFWAIHVVLLWLLFGRRSIPVALYALAVCFIATAKFAVPDSLHQTVARRVGYLDGFCRNRVFVVGLIVIVSWFACCIMARHWPRGREKPLFSRKNVHRLLVWGAILAIWLPTFEIVRGFHYEPFRNRFTDPSLAMHVALSVVWSLFAVTVLGIGFARLIAPLRYLAIAVFGITVVKVFIIDLSHLEMIYRIVSFIVLGALLLAASFLYQQLSNRILTKAADDQDVANKSATNSSRSSPFKTPS